MTDSNARGRLIGALLLASLVAMVAGAAVVVPSGLSLSPADPAGVLHAVRMQVGLHLAELALDVLGWLGLFAAGLVVAAGSARTYLEILAGGLLAGAGLAGLLHDGGNLAMTQLAARPAAPGVATVAFAVLLTAKWMVNLAGLLWVAATVAGAVGLAMPAWLRVVGVGAAVAGLVAVALPWTTGVGGPTVALERVGYVLLLPIMIWYGILGWRYLAVRPGSAAGLG